MMPNVSYGPMLNSTMTRGASLGSGIRSLLGLGNARNLAGGVSRGLIGLHFLIIHLKH